MVRRVEIRGSSDFHNEIFRPLAIRDSFIYRFFYALGNAGIWVVPLTLPVFLALYFYLAYFERPYKPGATETVIFAVTDQTDMDDIAKDLEEQGLIRSRYSVSVLSKKEEFKDKSGGPLRIVTGEYHLSPSMSPRQILTKLLSNERVTYTVQIDEVTTVREAAQRIADSGLSSLDEAKAALEDQALMRDLEIPAFIPEGYIPPGAYEFAKPIDPRQIVKTFVTKSAEYFESGINGWQKRAQEIGYTPYEMVTLASLVEKDSPTPEERENIASVYHNRLRIGMQLQSEAALAYGIPDFQGKITQQDIAEEGPYNTFRNTGFPSTPICTPTIESLRSVLYPKDTDYLYFVEAGDGRTLYSPTFGQHKENLRTAARIRAEKKAREKGAAEGAGGTAQPNDTGTAAPPGAVEPSAEDLSAILGE